MVTNEERIFARHLNKKYSYRIKPNNGSAAPYRINRHENSTDGGVGFLKIQHEPFFKSVEVFEIPPERCVIFQDSELQTYNSESDDAVVFLRAKWDYTAKKMNGAFVTVDPVEVILRINRTKLNWCIRNGPAPFEIKKSTAKLFAVDLNEFDPI